MTAIDWHRESLRRRDFSETYGINLRGANLSGCDLREANMRNVNLSDANLCSADMRGVDLRFANLRGADMLGADLRFADMRGVDLQNADLHNVDLRFTDMRGAYIREDTRMPRQEYWPTPDLRWSDPKVPPPAHAVPLPTCA